MTKFDELKIGDIFAFLSLRNKTYYYIYDKQESTAKYIQIEKFEATYGKTDKGTWNSRDFIFSRCTQGTEKGLLKTLFGDKEWMTSV